jgi:hypothetical protein
MKAYRFIAVLAVSALAAPLALAVLIGGGVAAVLVGLARSPSPPGDELAVDAIPAHARHLADWVNRAGRICPQISPPMVAAQLDVESRWRVDAVTDDPADRGGDTVGIVQFQADTWAVWGGDYDHDGRHSPDDPQDGIYALGRLVCDLAAWAGRHHRSGRLNGDPLHLAWAAYVCGRGCVLDAGGVPATGPAHDYPQRVRAKVPQYQRRGAWSAPLPAGSYQMVSRFRPPDRPGHDGIDLAAPTGTPIYAAAAGIVVDAGCTSPFCDRPGDLDAAGNGTTPGCGLRINLRHGGGIATRYCHAVRLAVTSGTQVRAGQLIAWVGSTGHSSGPHLHFEVHHRAPPLTADNAIDPQPFLAAVGVHLGQERA